MTIGVLALGIARRVLDAPLGRLLGRCCRMKTILDVMVNINIVDLFGFALNWLRADSVCFRFKLSCFSFRRWSIIKIITYMRYFLCIITS